MFEKAIELDPQYAGAYAWLGWSYFLIHWSQDPQQNLEQAFAAAQKAIALNDSLPWAHIALGAVYLWQKQPEQAHAAAERAIALDPNLADGYGLLAAILNTVGKPEEAIGVAEKAIRLGFHPHWYLFDLGHAYCLTGRYAEAIATLKQFVSRTPNVLHAQLVLASAYSEAGREEEARTAAAEVLRISPKFSLEVMRQRAPNTDPAVIERQVAALRKAGLK